MLKGGLESAALKFLKEDDIRKIHNATMQVLAEVGVQIGEPEALKLCAEKGAKVDFDKQRAYFSEELVMKAVETAPSVVTIYGRDDDSKNIVLGGNKVYLGTGGTALNIIDLDRVTRKTTVEDIANTARLVDGLDNVHFFVIPCHPSDVPAKELDVNRFYHSINNTTKPIMGGILNEDGVDRVLAMAAEIAGGMNKLAEKPFISFISSILSPLKLDDARTRILFKVAKAGIPIATSTAPLAGATSPITLAGTLVQMNAEALTGVVLTQMVNPGAPILYSAVPTIMDMQTMTFLFGSTESGIMNAAAAQLAQFYKLPIYSTGGISDSKQPDQQAGYEKALTAIMPALAGANFIHEAAGQLDSGMTISYAQYVVDNDIMGSVMRAVRGIEVDESTLATEVIARVGPGGNYLAQKQTVKKMRTEFFYPQAATRVNFDGWKKAGSKDTWTMAEEVARDILAKHQPKQIPQELAEKIRKTEPGIK
jgi:trimethylamine--corrinoid protein Co-methyltransferase